MLFCSENVTCKIFIKKKIETYDQIDLFPILGIHMPSPHTILFIILYIAAGFVHVWKSYSKKISQE